MSGTLKLSEEWRPLRQDIGSIISRIDSKFEKLEAEERRMEQKRDESYQQGAEDMREAVNMLYDASAIGLSSRKIEELFGTAYIPSILDCHPAINIITKIKQWKEEREKPKETEVKIGDEIEFLNTDIDKYKKYIVIVTDPDSNTFWLFNPVTFARLWIDKDDPNYKKTGRHFDTIYIPEGGAII